MKLEKPDWGEDYVPITGVRLRREGGYAIVDTEIGGDWIEVIRERYDGSYSHIVETSGMWDRYYQEPKV